MGGSVENHQRAAAEVRPKWQTEAHEKSAQRSHKGGLQIP